jgi:hypothetical protein
MVLLSLTHVCMVRISSLTAAQRSPTLLKFALAANLLRNSAVQSDVDNAPWQISSTAGIFKDDCSCNQDPTWLGQARLAAVQLEI